MRHVIIPYGLILLLILSVLQPQRCISAELSNEIPFTSEELAWISDHPIVNVRISASYPPFEFFDGGRYQGIAYDYLMMIGQRTGLTFQPVSAMSWTDSLESIERKNGLDLIVVITHTPERERFLNFTRDYISFPEVIFTRRDGRFVADIEDLAGLVVATENGFVESEFLRRDIPDVTLIETETTEEALESVAFGKSDAYVGNLAVGSYLIDKLGLVNLKVSASAPYGDDNYAMGVRKDWPELEGILEKSLDSLTAADHQKIKNQWLAIRYEHGSSVADIFKWVLIVSVVCMIWVAQLRWVVKRRTGELKKEADLRQEKEAALASQSALLQTILDTLPAPVYYKDTAGIYLGCNHAFEMFTGKSKDEIVGGTIYDVVPRELAHNYHLKDIELIRAGGSMSYESAVIYADSSLHDVISHKAVFSQPDGSPGGLVGTLLDITERKKAETELAKREKIFHGIFDQSFSLMGLLDPQGNVLEINTTAMMLTDADQDQVVGKPIWETTWWTDNAVAQQLLRDGVSRAANGEMVRFENSIQYGDELLIIDSTLKPLKDDYGNVVFIIQEGRDVSKTRQYEKILLSMAEGISSRTAEEFYHSLVMTMGKAMNADYAYIGQFKDDQCSMVETLALYAGGEIQDNIEYSLENSPCRHAINSKKVCSYPNLVAQLFPYDIHLQLMEAEGYVGFPLFSIGGEALGILVVLFRNPIKETATSENLLKVFGVRAAGELERQKSQYRLEESEENFRTIFQTNPDAVLVARQSDNCIVDCNEDFLLQSGYSRDEVIGKTSSELGLWANLDDRDQMYELLQKDGMVENFEFSAQRKNGQISPGLISLRVIQLGGVSHLLAVSRDISEAKKSEQALMDSELRYRELYTQFQALLDGISDALLLFSKERNVLWANQGAAHHFSRSVEGLAGLSCNDIWGDSAVECEEFISDVFQNAQSREINLVTDDGRCWGVKAFPIKNSLGTVVNVIQIASDITEKISLREEASRQSHLAALGELSAGIAHEINNPTGTILMSMPMIRDALIDALPVLEGHYQSQGDFDFGGLSFLEMKDQILPLVEDVKDGAQRIKRIVDDLKDFARPQDRGSSEKVDLGITIEKSVRLMNAFIRKSTDNFSLVLEEDVPPTSGQSQRIEQVVLNLIQNACQSLDNRNQAVRVKVFHDPKKVMNIIEVSDRGRGIKADDLAHIQEPFFTTRREMGGTGLGLSVSSRIIQEHGGKLEVESKFGEGSLFRVLLPVYKEG